MLEKIKIGDCFNKLKINKLALCFFVPLFILGIYQFILYSLGKFTFVANDCFYQYVSFFELFYQKVKEGSDFFSTLKAGLGTDFYSIYCYYLASPLNFLIFLFPKGSMGYAINFLIVLKLSLCGLTFGYALKKKFNSDKYLISFSCIWVFCGYFAGYYWNVMWLDVLILFPLLIVFMEELIYEKKVLKYTLVLALAIFCNYFMAYIVCIFLALKFFTLNFKNIKEFLLGGIRFAICSICGAGMAGIVIIPSYFILHSTTISDESLNDVKFEISGKISETLKNFMFGEVSNAITNNQFKANIHVCLFVLLLFGIYLAYRKINILDKIKNCLLIGFLIFSLNNEMLQFIWHGFHVQHGIPNRFAFLIIFMLIFCAYEVIKDIDKISLLEKFIGFIFSIGFFFLIYYYDKSIYTSFIISILIILFYFLTLIINYGSRILIFAEIITFFVISSASVSIDSLAAYNTYYDSMQEIQKEFDLGDVRSKYEEIGIDSGDMYSYKSTLLSQIREYKFKEARETFNNFLNALQNPTHKAMSNEGIYYGLSTPSLFNTFMYEGYYKFLFKSGNSGSNNTVSYAKDNIVDDMLLGLKYSFIRNDDELKDGENFSYEYVKTIGNIDIYKNKYALPLGYLVEKNISYEDFDKGNQFQVLNNLTNMLCEIEIFNREYFEITDTYNCTYQGDNPCYLSYNTIPLLC